MIEGENISKCKFILDYEIVESLGIYFKIQNIWHLYYSVGKLQQVFHCNL